MLLCISSLRDFAFKSNALSLPLPNYKRPVMSSRQLLVCNLCGQDKFKSSYGLRQHQRTSKRCASVVRAARGNLNLSLFGTGNDNTQLDPNAPHGRSSRQSLVEIESQIAEDNNLLSANDWEECSILSVQDEGVWGFAEYDWNLNEQEITPAEAPLHDFKHYARTTTIQNCVQLSIYEQSAINLMHLLRKKGATLDTYDAVMKWHMKELGDNDKSHFISQRKLFKMLHKRYNLDGYCQTQQLILPSLRAKVEITWHNACQNVVSLLTIPCLSDNDFLHFDDNPLAPPPDNIEYLEDINTNLAYTG